MPKRSAHMVRTWMWSEAQRRAGVLVITEYFTFEGNIKQSRCTGVEGR